MLKQRPPLADVRARANWRLAGIWERGGDDSWRSVDSRGRRRGPWRHDGPMTDVGRHLWLRPQDEPLSAWIHAPTSGMTRGMVVCCPPLGREASNTLNTFQTLCDRLASAGIAALRFDYTGFGDSAGNLDDPGRVQRWMSDVGAAVDFAREAQAGPVIVVGMRTGALVASESVARGTVVDSLILWDPLPSGRQFLRTEQVLLATAYDAPQMDDGSVSGPAFTYPLEVVTELASWTLGPAGDSPPPTVVLARRGSAAVGSARKRFADIDCTWIEIPEQVGLVDANPDKVVLPESTLSTVIDLCRQRSGNELIPLDVANVEVATVTSTPGRSVTERAVWLGPRRLLGVMTEPDDTDETTPTVIFLTAGVLDHTGPARMWVVLSRKFGLAGIRAVRVDIDGVGESFGRPDLVRMQALAPEAIDDLSDIASALGSPSGPGLIFIGLSTGGYHALEAGLHLRPTAVCAVNPSILTAVPELTATNDRVDPRRRAFRRMPRPLRGLAGKHLRVATYLWWAAQQPGFRGSVSGILGRIANQGTAVLVIASTGEAQQFEPSLYWSVAFRRLARRGMLDIKRISGSDHSLYTPEGQARGYPLLSDWVLTRYARPPLRSGSPLHGVPAPPGEPVSATPHRRG